LQSEADVLDEPARQAQPLREGENLLPKAPDSSSSEAPCEIHPPNRVRPRPPHERIGTIEGVWPAAHSQDAWVFIPPAADPRIKTGQEKREWRMNLALATYKQGILNHE